MLPKSEKVLFKPCAMAGVWWWWWCTTHALLFWLWELILHLGVVPDPTHFCLATWTANQLTNRNILWWQHSVMSIKDKVDIIRILEGVLQTNTMQGCDRGKITVWNILKVKDVLLKFCAATETNMSHQGRMWAVWERHKLQCSNRKPVAGLSSLTYQMM